MAPLSDDALAEVSGGVIFNSSGITGADPYYNWEVLDNNNGNVLDRYHTKEEAIIQTVKKYGGNNPRDIEEIGWDEVCRLRSR